MGVAPDTMLGSGIQTALRAIRRGDIGRPLSALTLMQSPGPDLWHPSPDFLFQSGGGPVLDMGPYYFSALVHVFGSVGRVQAVGHRAQETRRIVTGPRAGEEFAVTEPTNVALLLDFADGAFGMSHFSFDSPLARQGFVEITGTEATLVLPDPNTFGGASTLVTPDGEKRELPVDADGQGRGLGVVDMARAIRGGGELQAGGALGLHVLDVMLSSLQVARGALAGRRETDAPARAAARRGLGRARRRRSARSVAAGLSAPAGTSPEERACSSAVRCRMSSSDHSPSAWLRRFSVGRRASASLIAPVSVTASRLDRPSVGSGVRATRSRPSSSRTVRLTSPLSATSASARADRVIGPSRAIVPRIL